MSEVDTTPCVVLIKSCGCLSAVVVETPDHIAESAKLIASWSRRKGVSLSRMTVGAFKAIPMKCEAHRGKQLDLAK